MRQQLVPHPVAGHAQVGVRRILAERELPLGEIAPQLGPADRQQRPDQDPDAGAHAGQPGRAGAADQPQQHRLGLVVDGVAQRDPAGVQFAGRPPEEGAAHLVPGLLDGDPPGPRQVGHVRRLDDAGHAEPLREPPAEALVLVGLRPAQPVVHVGHPREGHDRPPRQLAEQVQQGHRIAAARHGRHDAPPGRDQRPRLDRRGYAVGERHGRIPGAGLRTVRFGLPKPREKWCRCRDLNPGRRGYEPRALTS